MSYWSEFRAGWRPLAAAALGMGSGLSVTGAITSTMAPHFLKELHWAPGDFAKVGTLTIIMAFFIPVAGRLADVWGVRKTAAIGVIVLPLCMIALSRMNGGIGQYYAIFVVEAVLCVTTTATVFSRLVVANFVRARGLALAIAASMPGVTGVLVGLFLTPFVELHGWRAGYLTVGGIALVCGAIAVWLVPPQRREVSVDTAAGAVAPPRRRSWADYPVIFRTPAFWLLMVAMVLCNFYQTLGLTQTNMLILANGVDASRVGGIVAVYGIAIVLGRFACGAAIDWLPGHIVATVGMGLPAVGLFLLASPLDTYPVVLVAMLFMGLAFGAEGDLIGVLVARAFGVSIYGSVMGLVTGAISLASAAGALLLSVLLTRYGNYNLFLAITGVTTVAGSLMFLLLPRARVPDMVEPEAGVAA